MQLGSTLASKMWIWWPSKVLTIKLEYSTRRDSAKYDIFLRIVKRAINIETKRNYGNISLINKRNIIKSFNALQLTLNQLIFVTVASIYASYLFISVLSLLLSSVTCNTSPNQTTPLGQILASQLAISQKASKLQINHALVTISFFLLQLQVCYFQKYQLGELQSPSSVGAKRPLVLKPISILQ